MRQDKVLKKFQFGTIALPNFHLKTGLGDIAEITIQCAMLYK
jgi:hypothetical protein